MTAMTGGPMHTFLQAGGRTVKSSAAFIKQRGSIIHLANEFNGGSGSIDVLLRKLTAGQSNLGLDVKVVRPYHSAFVTEGFHDDGKLLSKQVGNVSLFVIKTGMSCEYPNGDNAMAEYEAFARGFMEILSRPEFARLAIVHAHDYGMGYVLMKLDLPAETKKIFTMYDPNRMDLLFPRGAKKDGVFASPFDGIVHNEGISGIKAGVQCADICTYWSKEWWENVLKGSYGGFIEHAQKTSGKFFKIGQWDPTISKEIIPDAEADAFILAYEKAIFGFKREQGAKIFHVGEDKPSKEDSGEQHQVLFGDIPCDLVTGPSMTVAVPKEFGYLLSGLTGKDKTPWHGLPLDVQAQRFNDIIQIGFETAGNIRELTKKIGIPKISSSRIQLIMPQEITAVEGMNVETAGQFGELGEKLIREGALARVTLAAGAAERFRNPGDTRPKALIEICDGCDLSKETYISVQAKDILQARRRYQTIIPWLLFINPLHRYMFRKYFEKNNYFDLDPETVLFVEHTGRVPKFTAEGMIATEANQEGGDPLSEKVVFATSGHGYFATAFRNNPVIIREKELAHSPYAELARRGIKVLFQSNVDNLGANISTNDYRIILGYYTQKEAKDNFKMLVEVTTPLIGQRTDLSRYFWDEGGVPLLVDGIPTVVDANVLEGDILKVIMDDQKPTPFNTANATFGINSIPAKVQLPETIQERKRLLGYETNFWNITGLIKTAFINVPRNIPLSLSTLPPEKAGGQPGQMVLPQAINDGNPVRNRFIPTKQYCHRDFAAKLYSLMLASNG